MDLIPGPAARVFSRTCAWCFLAPPVWTRVRVVPKVSEPFEHRMPNPNQYQNAWTKNKSGPVNRSSPCNLKPTTFNIGRHVQEIACWKAGGLASVSFMFIRNLWFPITISKLKLQAGNRTQGMLVIRARWVIAHGTSFDNTHRARHVMCRNVLFSQMLPLRHHSNENTRCEQGQQSNFVAVDKGIVYHGHGYSPAGAQVSRARRWMWSCVAATTSFAFLMDRVRLCTSRRRVGNRSSRSTSSP